MLDDFDMDFPEEEDDFGLEEEESSSSGGGGRNRTVLLIVGGIVGLIILGVIFVFIYLNVIRPMQNPSANAPTATFTAVVTNTFLPTSTQAPTDTPAPTDTQAPTATDAAIPDVGGDGGPTPDPRTATVEALLTQAALAQTQAAAQLLTQSPTPTATATGLPDTGIMDDLGAPTIVATAALLILVIFIARRLRAAAA